MSSFSDRCANEDEQDRLALVHASIGKINHDRLTASVREERATLHSQARIRSAFHSIATELMNWTPQPTDPVSFLNPV